jgi:predicted ArsR family transcriptional regulator
MIPKQINGSAAGQVLTALQRRGSATVKELEEALGVTATAVRQQLVQLMAEGYVEQAVERNDGRGRPSHIYSLTTAGRSLFPHHYDEFTNGLLREILVSEGPGKVQHLLQRIGQKLAEQYAGQITADAPAARATALAELLNARGILAEIVEGPDGIQVHEYTCPYYELAREHRAICDMEQDMMTYVIRQPVALVSCSLDGHHGCEFRIEPEAVGVAVNT